MIKVSILVILLRNNLSMTNIINAWGPKETIWIITKKR